MNVGQYYCWNRTYDINTGRWTTPDPVATPWWNLQDYCSTKPNRNSDPSGLFVSLLRDVLDTFEHVALRKLLRKLAVNIFPMPGVTTGDLRELMRLRRSAPRHLVKGMEGVSLGPDPGNPGGFVGFPKGGGRREFIEEKPPEEKSPKERPPEDNCDKRRTAQAPTDFRSMEVGIETLSGWIRAGQNTASQMTDITTPYFWNFELTTDPATGQLVGKLVQYTCMGPCETGKNCRIVEVDSVDSTEDDVPPGTQTPIYGCACE